MRKIRLAGIMVLVLGVTSSLGLAQDELTLRREDGTVVDHPLGFTWGGGNYQVLHNGVDLVFDGVGAGLLQEPGTDGIGTWIPGEELRGNQLTTLGDFGYRMSGFRETVFVEGPDLGTLAIKFPYLAWVEFDGANGHKPHVFTRPFCSPGMPVVGNDAMPYGTPPLSSDSFLLAQNLGGLDLLLPNEGLDPATTATATTILEILDLELPISGGDFIWEIQLELVTPVESPDDIDGWWHWATNSPDDNQYWGISVDDLGLWHSHTVLSDDNMQAVKTLNAGEEYGLLLMSADPVTHAALAPLGWLGAGPYSAVGPLLGGINGGFDLGRGSQAIALKGIGGVTNNTWTGMTNQDPSQSGIPGVQSTIGFVTFDNTDYDGDGDYLATPPTGSKRVTWIDVDFGVVLGTDPAASPSAVTYFGLSRVPLQVSGPPWPQPVTLQFLSLFTHDATGTLPDPGGFGGLESEFGVPIVAGASIHVPTGLLNPVCLGIPVALQYGTSGLLPTNAFTWNPAITRVSGTRQIFLFD